MRVCRSIGCTATLLPWAKKFCPACAAYRLAMARRRAQKRFYQRRRTGKGVPPSRRQLLRNGLPTTWALAHPKLALKEWHRRNPGEQTAPSELVEALVTVR